MTLAIMTVLIILLAVAGLALWRQSDRLADRSAMQHLIASQPRQVPRFDLSMVDSLPAPAQRYFRFAIAPGTPLRTVARLRMSGQFGLGDRSKPRYLAMTAKQVLAAPTGFVWCMGARLGALSLSGSDSTSWTRFWLAGLVPVARAGGNADHARSAFGRLIGEAAFWTPAALLPATGAQWREVDADTAEVTIGEGDRQQTVTLRIDAEGRPTEVSFARWSNANPDRVFRLQPFGGYLAEHREFGGFTVPTWVEAGNQFGTAEYFPFFKVKIESMHFPEPHA